MEDGVLSTDLTAVRRLSDMRLADALVPIFDTGALFNRQRLSWFLSLGGATLCYIIDEYKLNSYGLHTHKQLKYAKLRNVRHKPRTYASGPKPLRSKAPFWTIGPL